MTDFRIIFIHGYTASRLSDWYPAISKELDRLGIDYKIPDLPGGLYPHAKNWLDILHKVISKNKKELILVGHSLGSRTALLYIDKYMPKVEKVFLIAAFTNDTANAERNDGKAYPDFFEYRINLEKIKPQVGKFIVIHSRDDSSIPFKQGSRIAKDLGAKLVPFDGRNHFYDPEDAAVILEQLRKELHF